MKTAPTMMDFALRYRKRGFSVIPCKKDKRPFIKWEPYQLQKASETEIKQWWTDHPDANIGIVCGPVSGIDVLDVDTQDAFDALQENWLPDTLRTPTSKTPKGRHLYFKHRSGLSNSVRAVPGTDIRTHGGYVVAPPSANGDGRPYYWMDGLTPKDCEFAEWPEELFRVLEIASQGKALSSSISSIYKHGGVIGGEVTPRQKDCLHSTTSSTSVYKLFNEGTRDNDLFHIANCLVKGGCEKESISQVLEILAKNCNPPFDAKEIPAKIQSALNRKGCRERNLASEIREWVLSTNGVFLSTSVYNDLQLSTRDERKNVSIILKRMSEDNPPLIEKVGSKNGEWRLIDQSCAPMDWMNASCDYLPLWMPLGLGEITGVQPGNILVFAGAKDSGKTAWLLNLAKENRSRYKVHYFNSEMGPAEFKLRVSKFPDTSVSQWKDVSVYERSENFADVIKSGEGNLNIIDFLEVVDEFWRVAAVIQKIHQKLNGALCVIALQKNPKVDLGRGGAFSLEKARLYVSLDYQQAKIISCKNFKPNELIEGNPRGYTCRYKLVDGCRIQKQAPGWTSPSEREEK